MEAPNLINLKQELKNNLEQDIRIVLNLMETKIRYDSPVQNEVIFLIARLKDITDNASKDLIDFNIVTREKNKIRESVMQLVDNLRQEDLVIEDENNITISRLRYENRMLKSEIERLKKEIKKLENQKSVIHLEKLRILEGYWLEIIFDHKNADRLFSIARFYFNEIKNEFEFSGKNYKNNGTPYYEWNTINLVTDIKTNKFYLFYTTSPFGNAQSESFGSAVISYSGSKKQQLKIEKGYFMDVVDVKIPKNFVCFKLEDIAQKINFGQNIENEINHNDFVKTLYEMKDKVDIFKPYL